MGGSTDYNDHDAGYHGHGHNHANNNNNSMFLFALVVVVLVIMMSTLGGNVRKPAAAATTKMIRGGDGDDVGGRNDRRNEVVDDDDDANYNDHDYDHDDDVDDDHDNDVSSTKKKKKKKKINNNNNNDIVDNTIAAAASLPPGKNLDMGVDEGMLDIVKTEIGDIEDVDPVSAAAAVPTPTTTPRRKRTLSRGFAALEKMVNIVMTNTRKTLDRMSIKDYTLDERVIALAYAYIESRKQPNSKPPSSIRLKQTLRMVLGEKIWPHVTYLCTVFATNRDYLRDIGATLKEHEQTLAARDHSALRADLLFINLMLCDSVNQTIDPSHVFIGTEQVYRVDDFAATFALMTEHFQQQLQLECQNIADHTRTEFGLSHFLRYWQLELLRHTHGQQYDGVFYNYNFASNLTNHVRDTCLGSIGQSIAVQYEILALQTLIRMVNETPEIFYGSNHTLNGFAYNFTLRMHRVFSSVRAFLPTYLMDMTALPLNLKYFEELDSMPPRQLVALEYPRNVTYNVTSKRVSLLHRSYRHLITINRVLAPLPTYEQPLATMCGRMYLGAGHDAMVSRFQQIRVFALKPITVNLQPDDVDAADQLDNFLNNPESVQQQTAVSLPNRTAARRRIYLFPFTHRRTAYELAVDPRQQVNVMRASGLITVDTKHAQVITHLQVDHQQTPLKDAVVGDYRCWLMHLFSVLTQEIDETAMSRAEFASKATNKQLSRYTLRKLAGISQFFEIAVNVYAYSVSRVKCNKFIFSSSERVVRRWFRKRLCESDIRTATSLQPPKHLLSEGWWYSGTRSWFDEPVDITSTADVVERTVSRAEETLWVSLAKWTDRLADRLTRRMPADAVKLGTVLRNRLTGMLVLAVVAVRYHRLTHLSPIMHLESLLDDAAYSTLLPFVKSTLCMPAASLLKHQPTTQPSPPPTLTVIYERRIPCSSYNVASLTATASPSDAAAIIGAANDKAAIEAAQVLVTLDKHEHQYVLSAANNVSPVSLSTGASILELERELGGDNNNNFDASYLDWKRLPEAEFTETAEPLSLHVWFQHVSEPRKADGSAVNINDRQTLRNLVTIRVPHDRKHGDDFKLFNLLYDDTQYLVVSQSGNTSSKLWYSVCTYENTVPLGQENKILLDSQQRFHTELIAGPANDWSKVRQSPAFKLLATPSNSVDQLIDYNYDETQFQRYTFAGTIADDENGNLAKLYPRLNEQLDDGRQP